MYWLLSSVVLPPPSGCFIPQELNYTDPPLSAIMNWFCGCVWGGGGRKLLHSPEEWKLRASTAHASQ